ncbi:MAG TPA: response regulator [Bacteroidia bacterium]|jgi:two-component system response regulator|nr:response regulator [Bacteroidia bacterium]
MNNQFTIIIADDDKDDHEFLIDAIHEQNKESQILSVFDGTELMDVLLGVNKNNDPSFAKPDLIFLDLNMPLMDGYEVLQTVRRNDALKSIPIYVLTTSEFEFDKIKAVAYGANAFYSKPMLPGGLKKIVEEVLSKHIPSIKVKDKKSHEQNEIHMNNAKKAS